MLKPLHPWYLEKRPMRSEGQRGRMISEPDRKKAIELINEAVINGASQDKACQELGITARTLHRWMNINTPNEDQRPIVKRPIPPNKLSVEEKKRLLQYVTSLKWTHCQGHKKKEIKQLEADSYT